MRTKNKSICDLCGKNAFLLPHGSHYERTDHYFPKWLCEKCRNEWHSVYRTIEPLLNDAYDLEARGKIWVAKFKEWMGIDLLRIC